LLWAMQRGVITRESSAAYQVVGHNTPKQMLDTLKHIQKSCICPMDVIYAHVSQYPPVSGAFAVTGSICSMQGMRVCVGKGVVISKPFNTDTLSSSFVTPTMAKPTARLGTPLGRCDTTPHTTIAGTSLACYPLLLQRGSGM